MSGFVPRGFRVAGVYCGIKKNAEKKDLGLIVCDRDAVAAGVYTTNLVHASAVATNRQKTPTRSIRAVVYNSGNANTCTGEQGLADTRRMAELAAAACGANPNQVLVMSTGVIGRPLPMEKVAAGIATASQRLGQDDASFQTALHALMTTDAFEKRTTTELNISGKSARLTGIAKGAGMIAPNMATMLSVFMTDVNLTPNDAQACLQAAVDRSFNCISVEGHMSTSDTVLLLASGAAGEEPLQGSALDQFRERLTEQAIELAKMIPNDGEGATHLITIDVTGCGSRDDARRIARAIADSPLVKTGIAGGDPNWGRIVSAAGYAGAAFDPAKLQLTMNGMLIYRDGGPTECDLSVLAKSLKQNRDTHIEIAFGEGNESIRFWTSDLTVEYVRFNSDYTT